LFAEELLILKLPVKASSRPKFSEYLGQGDVAHTIFPILTL
jgi:hypothetical protein